MFQKVLRYTGRHRKTTYASILVLVAGVAMSVLPYFFLYRLLRPPADRGQSHVGGNPDERRGHGSVHGPLRPVLCGRTGSVSSLRLSYFGKTSGSISRASWKSSPWARSGRRALESGKRCSLTTLKEHGTSAGPRPAGRAVQSGGAGGGICGPCSSRTGSWVCFPSAPSPWACWPWA